MAAFEMLSLKDPLSRLPKKSPFKPLRRRP